MAIIKTVCFNDFVREFEAYGRGNNFSYSGLRALFDYLEELSEQCEKDFELDVVALCCDYCEDDAETIAGQYDIDLSDCEDEYEKIEVVREYLENKTSVVGEAGGGVFVYAAF